ncbi:MAG: hypothetical protein LBU48_01065 [Coriobacteriales bacterium]|nr:hypothetical protein [Coriobacteriales bacterium]
MAKRCPPPEILALLEPLQGNESAAELFARASFALFEPEFQEGQCVRIGLPETTAGLSIPLVVIVGAINGFFPSLGTLNSCDDSHSHEDWIASRSLFYSALTKAEQELIISCFQKEPIEKAESLGMDIRRIRVENGERKALLSPSVFLDEMGASLPGTVSEL